MEIFVNLIEAAVRLTEGFNPVKYACSSRYRQEFHDRRGTRGMLGLVAFGIGLLVIIALLGAFVAIVVMGLRNAHQ